MRPQPQRAPMRRRQRLGQRQRRHHQQRAGQHDQHREDPVPAGVQKHRRAQRGGQHRRDAEHQHQPRHDRRGRRVVEQVADHGDRHHHRGGGAHALQRAGHGQHGQVGRQQAQQRRHHVQHDPGHQRPAAAQRVRQRPDDELPDGQARPACRSTSAAPPTTTPPARRRCAAARAGTCRWSADRAPPGRRARRSSWSARARPPARPGSCRERWSQAAMLPCTPTAPLRDYLFLLRLSDPR